MNLLALIDQTVADVIASHPDYFTLRGKESGRAQKQIVRKVAKALRESLSAPREDDDGAAGERRSVADPDPQPENWQCEVWSREWWALFLAAAERRRPFALFLLERAARAQKGETVAVGTDQAPPADLLNRLQSYPSDGEAVKAWRWWFARRGIRLPEWRSKVWVFLPNADPPKESSAA